MFAGLDSTCRAFADEVENIVNPNKQPLDKCIVQNKVGRTPPTPPCGTSSTNVILRGAIWTNTLTSPCSQLEIAQVSMSPSDMSSRNLELAIYLRGEAMPRTTSSKIEATLYVNADQNDVTGTSKGQPISKMYTTPLFSKWRKIWI